MNRSADNIEIGIISHSATLTAKRRRTLGDTRPTFVRALGRVYANTRQQSEPSNRGTLFLSDGQTAAVHFFFTVAPNQHAYTTLRASQLQPQTSMVTPLISFSFSPLLGQCPSCILHQRAVYHDVSLLSDFLVLVVYPLRWIGRPHKHTVMTDHQALTHFLVLYARHQQHALPLGNCPPKLRLYRKARTREAKRWNLLPERMALLNKPGGACQ